MLIERINPLTKLPFIVDLVLTNEQIEKHKNGTLIQYSMSTITPDEREFYLSGIPMGLFEIQFEKRFVTIVNLGTDKRAEIYFAKSLEQFFVYEMTDNELSSINKFHWKIIANQIYLEVNKIPESVLNIFNSELNKNKDLIEFCKNIQNKTVAKYSEDDLLTILKEHSKFIHKSYEIPYTEQIVFSTGYWLSGYLKLKEEK